MPDKSLNWRPGCTLPVLQHRAQLRRTVHRFFHERGYLEVDTPSLSHDIVVDACLEPLETHVGGRRMFLQTSPEAAMKRLLAAGSGSIYQLTRSFRAGERGALHNPEFTMLEWYGAGSSWRQQLLFTEDLIRTAARELPAGTPDTWREAPFRVTTYQLAFERALGLDVLTASDEELQSLVDTRDDLPSAAPSSDRDELLNLLLASAIEPQLGKHGPEFLIDYPASQAALAELSPEDHRVARRFELYIGGVEICNGYQELTNATELRVRDLQQNARRSRQQVAHLPGAERLLSAMDAGLPQCSGVALGFDRLLMVLLSKSSLDSVMPFSIERA